MMEKISVLCYIDPSVRYIKVQMLDFQLNAVDGNVLVYIYDKDDFKIDCRRLYIPPDVWTEWGTDDDFLIDYCIQTLGMIRKPELMFHFDP